LEPPAGAVELDEPELPVPEELVAADAMPAAPRPAPVTSAPETRSLRTIEERLDMEIPLCLAPGLSRMRPSTLDDHSEFTLGAGREQSQTCPLRPRVTRKEEPA
jgi:hypothetical protein